MPDLLRSVTAPDQLRRLAPAELVQLAAEIREFLVGAVARTGGHLGPNLGAVELTLAVHRVFRSPREPIIWDTGHQSYVHKLVTGRLDRFGTLRQRGGLSGYPSRAESEHDWVENSHASTALSYACGLARAHALQDDQRPVVAVIGDGALTGGLAWEALNNLAAARDLPVVIVLNDNGRSYAPTVGGLAEGCARLHGESAATAGPGSARGVFTGLGLHYLGPVDGHDVEAVEAALRAARDHGSPVVVHCVTRKGRGYAPAERDDADRFHGIGRIDPLTGRPAGPEVRSWTQAFGDAALRLADRDERVVGVTAAMLQPVGLSPFATAHPSRVFDVGIAEQHAVTFASGLALAGFRPLVCLYATFLNRAFDQVVMDVALHRLPVVFVLDRAGVTGEDGASHHGMWDVGLLAAVPGMRIAAPRDAVVLEELLSEAIDCGGPVALRFPKGEVGGEVPVLYRQGTLDVLGRTGNDVLVVSYGPMAATALQAAGIAGAHGIGVTVVDPRWATPVSPELVELAAQHRAVVTIEDAGRANGAGASLAAALRDAAVDVPVRVHGIPPAFLEQGSRRLLLDQLGLCAQAFARALVTAASASVRGRGAHHPVVPSLAAVVPRRPPAVTEVMAIVPR